MGREGTSWEVHRNFLSWGKLAVGSKNLLMLCTPAPRFRLHFPMSVGQESLLINMWFVGLPLRSYLRGAEPWLVPITEYVPSGYMHRRPRSSAPSRPLIAHWQEMDHICKPYRATGHPEIRISRLHLATALPVQLTPFLEADQVVIWHFNRRGSGWRRLGNRAARWSGESYQAKCLEGESVDQVTPEDWWRLFPTSQQPLRLGIPSLLELGGWFS